MKMPRLKYVINVKSIMIENRLCVEFYCFLEFENKVDKYVE